MGNSQGFIILGTTISQDSGDLGLSQIQSVVFFFLQLWNVN